MKTRTLLAGVAAAALLTGCSNAPQAQPSPSASSTPSPSPTKTLTAKEQAIAKGQEAIRAYHQTIVDIYASPDPRIDDMHDVAYGIALENAMKGLLKGLTAGWTTTEGTVKVAWVKPVSLGKKKMVLYACVDRTAIKGGYEGEKKKAYDRFAGDYDIEKIEDRWLVTRTVTHGNAKQVTPC